MTTLVSVLFALFVVAALWVIAAWFRGLLRADTEQAVTDGNVAHFRALGSDQPPLGSVAGGMSPNRPSPAPKPTTERTQR